MWKGSLVCPILPVLPPSAKHSPHKQRRAIPEFCQSGCPSRVTDYSSVLILVRIYLYDIMVEYIDELLWSIHSSVDKTRQR